MRVWYGYSKLTKKAVRKRELAIYFENHYSYKNDEWISKRLHVVYVRQQTDAETSDGLESNRMFTKYSVFIDQKPFNGDIERVLEHNFNADSENVSQAERTEIRNKLREAYYSFFDMQKPKVIQTEIEF